MHVEILNSCYYCRRSLSYFSDKFSRNCLFYDEADSGGTHEEGLRTILSKFMNMIRNVEVVGVGCYTNSVT